MPSACWNRVRVQIEHARRGRRRGEHARRALRMKAAEEEAHGGRIADARPDFVAGRHGGDELAALRAAPPPPRRRAPPVSRASPCGGSTPCGCRRARRRARPCRSRARRATRTSCRPCRSGWPRDRAPSPSASSRHLARPRQRRAEQAAAEAVEHAELDALDHLARNVLEAQGGGERREIARGVFVQRGLGGAHVRCVVLTFAPDRTGCRGRTRCSITPDGSVQRPYRAARGTAAAPAELQPAPCMPARRECIGTHGTAHASIHESDTHSQSRRRRRQAGDRRTDRGAPQGGRATRFATSPRRRRAGTRRSRSRPMSSSWPPATAPSAR